MTYNPDIPIGAISPLTQVTDVQTNFSQFNTVFTVNHIGFVRGQGNHKEVVMTVQADDPEVTQDLCALYGKDADSRAGTQPQLFMRTPEFLPTSDNPVNETNSPIQLTYDQVNTGSSPYQSFMAGGFLIYFGSTTDITNPVILSPAPTKIVYASATPNTMTTVGTPQPFQVFVTIDTATNDRFTISSTLNSVVIPYSFTFLAVGTV